MTKSVHLGDRQDPVGPPESHLICLTMVDGFCIPLMPLIKDLIDSIVNYRLGYAPTRREPFLTNSAVLIAC
jgi:hypothetical protein